MKKLRVILFALAAIIITGQLFLIDYSNLSWSSNAGSYLSILSMLFLGISLVMSTRQERHSGKL